MKPSTLILKIWRAWGEEGADVSFIVKKIKQRKQKEVSLIFIKLIFQILLFNEINYMQQLKSYIISYNEYNMLYFLTVKQILNEIKLNNIKNFIAFLPFFVHDDTGKKYNLKGLNTIFIFP